MAIVPETGREPDPASDDNLLLPLEARSALECWTPSQIKALWSYLHNGNGLYEFVMGFRDETTDTKQYKRSKKVPVHRGITWSLSTIQGRAKPGKLLTFVPYSTDIAQKSVWGGLDFDAHDGNTERARRYAFAALTILKDYDFALVLEESGSGGWHLWVISASPKPAKFWCRLLRGIARDIGARVESGICEVFPSESLSCGLGSGLRAPGSWNPGTKAVSTIYWQNADALIDALPPFRSKGPTARIGELTPPSRESSPIEKEVSLSSLSMKEIGKLIGGVEELRISQQGTRHKKLCSLVGETFHQLAHHLVERLARVQYTEKTVETRATEAEHLAEFAVLYQGMQKKWLTSLSTTERNHYDKLTTENEQVAFRIIRNFARKAAEDEATDFPIVRDNLAARVGLTGRGAGVLRMRFVRLEIIAQTAEYKSNVAAARYRWLLHAAG